MQAEPGAYGAKCILLSFDELAIRLATFWKENLIEVARQDKALKLQPQEKLLEVSYENLCADKTDVLRKFCDFVHIDIDLFNRTVWDIQTDSRNHKWETGFSSNVIDQLYRQMEPVITTKGYI